MQQLNPDLYVKESFNALLTKSFAVEVDNDFFLPKLCSPHFFLGTDFSVSLACCWVIKNRSTCVTSLGG